MKMFSVDYGAAAAASLLLQSVAGVGIFENCEAKKPAYDGVNTVTITTNSEGYVTSQRMTTICPMEKYNDVDIVSGDRIAYKDNVYVFLSVEEYETLMKKINLFEAMAKKRWDIQHSTPQGRAEWHGGIVSTTYATNAVGRLTKTVEYSDGYKFVEEAKQTKALTKTAPKPVTRSPDYMKALKAKHNKVFIKKEVK